ncbi:type I restriction endonuclease subunit S [Edwardsiella ictaluri]|uniref:Type I restriction-modification system, S subunit, putative n=1 Tax=Edwardsiella ictaluri (strain 93-146) TaxID=634503 RepID=C5B9C5_EDWI9|nr:restriction endonuclease subunit S [Edwardsiella ictaluri]ACR67305.1 type I restriction-modification system, S subunit, putative [Edwardsiella ictaluri 93-146]AVZ82178.1 type I restriction endonuclease subunit S [Edwardsiella ictaluri]EKS7763512.1 restriction endonuclease subunit S [Edwardsiella ictaluri]EKS7770332.1 restriction endonuclease subunit S [Edwardsiella ictaluri]EKS7773473.1 restriction endonuclease subunit S [Edwardsiella ictaluri]
MAIENLITDHLDLWTAAVRPKSSAGRGASSKLELTGIKKLRELILELAVRGKLVSQDPCDEPASVLLERIAAEKARLVKEGKLKKPKALPEISEEEQPFDLPEGWAWGSIGYITEFVNGYAFKSSDFASEGVGIVKIGDIQDGEIVVDNMSRVSQHVVDGLNENLQVKSGDMLIAMSGATTGKLGFNKTDEIFYLNQRVGKFITYLVDKEFLYYPLATKIAENLAKAMGSAIPNISTKQINEITIALPPLAEQHRIVAKVDELMALCDQLEQCSESQLAAHQTLVEALLATLTDSSDTEELAQNWARLNTHFDTLFTTEASIDALKQTILQLAVMGKLVQQDPSDEPASALLARIAAEKAQLIKEKKIKKEKPLPAISEDEKPFSLPKGWDFAYMQDLCYLITDGTHQTPKYTDDGRPFISAQCVKPFRFMPEFCRYVSEEHYQLYIKNRRPEFGDILLSRVGAGIGEAAVIDSCLEFAIYVSTGLLKPNRGAVYSKYLELWLNSPIGRGFSERNTLGKGVSQGNLNLSLIRSFIVSLPPKKEQKLIVAKVGEMITLCDQLKSCLQTSQQTQLALAESLVEGAIA